MHIKKVVITWAFLCSYYAGACQEPINILYGPSFSVRFYKEYIHKFNENLEQITKCTVNSILEPTYEAYIKSLAGNKAHMSFVPSHYEYALIGIGYKRILRGADGAKIVLIGSKKHLISNDIMQLRGKEILAPSIYTQAYLFLDDWLKEYKIIDDVKINLVTSHDVIARQLVRGATPAGVLTTSIYSRLPKNIKDGFYVMKESQEIYALLMINMNVSNSLRKAIVKSASFVNFGQWYESHDLVEPSKGSLRFSEQLNKLMER